MSKLEVERTPCFSLFDDKPFQKIEYNQQIILDDLAFKLIHAIKSNNRDEITRILKIDHKIMSRCVERIRPLDVLLNGPHNWSDNHPERLNIISDLFKSGYLKQAAFSDTDLINVLSTYCGWEYNEKKIDILMVHIPATRWIRARDSEFGSCLHSCLGHGTNKYMNLLLDMGCDPRVKSSFGTIYLGVASIANLEILTRLLDTVKMDVNEKELPNYEFPDHYMDLRNPICQMLERFAYTKTAKILEEVRQCIALLIKHGIDLDYVIPSSNSGKRQGEGCTVYDYMIAHGWVEFLKNTMPLPLGHSGIAARIHKDWEKSRSSIQTELLESKYNLEIVVEESAILQKLLDGIYSVRFSKDQNVISLWTTKIVDTVKLLNNKIASQLDHPFAESGKIRDLLQRFEDLYGFMDLKPVKSVLQ